MRRREFITLVGGAAAIAWPLAARAQQQDRVRRLGILMGGLLEGDPGGESELVAFRDGLDALGWKIGRNIQAEYRWPGTDIERSRSSARDLAGLRLDVILSRGIIATAALKSEAPRTPIVFVLVVEPVRSGLVQSLARPGGNITGFSNFEASIGGKWVELLKHISPSLSRIGLLFNPQTAPFAEAFLASAKAAGGLLQAEVTMLPVANDTEIENALVDLGRQQSGGLIGITDTFVTERRDLIISLAAQHRVPAVYGNRIFTRSGGLAAYAADYSDLFRRSASYVDRIIKGANPAELPVQQPSKFELSINLKSAKALGLDIPAQLIGLADEVIE